MYVYSIYIYIYIILRFSIKRSFFFCHKVNQQPYDLCEKKKNTNSAHVSLEFLPLHNFRNRSLSIKQPSVRVYHWNSRNRTADATLKSPIKIIQQALLCYHICKSIAVRSYNYNKIINIVTRQQSISKLRLFLVAKRKECDLFSVFSSLYKRRYIILFVDRE